MKNKVCIIKIIKILILIVVVSSYNLKNINTIHGDYEQGKSLFKKECTSCHSINLRSKLIGPPLFEITKKKSYSWLKKWIKNNKKLRLSGDKQAIKIYKEYEGLEMNNFDYLKDSDINNILYFIDTWHPEKTLNNINNTKQNTSFKINTDEKDNNTPIVLKKTITLGCICISVILLLILYKMYELLNLLNIKTLKEYKKLYSNKNNKYLYHIICNIIKITIKNKIFIFIILSSLGITSIYQSWRFLMNIDINKNYQPEQPIYFSHKIHSKINHINCLYCHYNVKYDKYADIPSINICMNCHNQIKEYSGNYVELNKSKEFYNNEINKIYNYSGWNPLVNKYTNKKRPIKWIKIHNMPDFVNFNHYQHVVIGKEKIKKNKHVNIVCYACHGVIENMDEVKMVNDLTMGWCIQCHRTTEININNYYYKNFYDKLIKTNNKITVDKVGGLECNKCHY